MSGEQAEERTVREGRERAEAQLLDELGLSFHRVGNSLQVTLFDPFKIESLVPADKSYSAHFAMDKVWKKLIQMRVATNMAAENSPAQPETTNSPTKPACPECSRLASRVERLEIALRECEEVMILMRCNADLREPATRPDALRMAKAMKLAHEALKTNGAGAHVEEK